jgi:signal transduction histidine kinase
MLKLRGIFIPSALGVKLKNRVFKKLAFAIFSSIILVEGLLWVFSVNVKKTELKQLQAQEITFHGEAKIYNDSFIRQELVDYTFNIFWLSLLISLVVSLFFFVIYNYFVGRHIERLTKLNNSDEPLIEIKQLEHLPNDEIGDLTRSRQNLLEKLEFKILENKKLLRILTHDLANSLSVILTSAQTIQKKGESIPYDYLSKRVSKIVSASFNQSELIDSVRQMDALTSGKYKPDLKPYRAIELIEKSLALFEHKLSEKKLFVKLDLEEGATLCVEEVFFVNSVLNNLLSNAIKFSKPGANIDIGCYSENRKTYFSVKDNGIGIPSELVDKIFDATEKTSRPGTSGEKGTGFGMPLVKQIVEAFSGEILVESRVSEDDGNSGTKFTLVFNQA